MTNPVSWVGRLITWILGLGVAIVVVVLTVANRQSVTLSADPLAGVASNLTIEVPVFLLAFSAFLLGLFTGLIYQWMADGRHRKEKRKARAEAAVLRRNLARTEDELQKSQDDISAAPSGGAAVPALTAGGRAASQR
ncbi:MAG: LapA family protein [Pseudomonadota bacterium]